jgi:hypothetical protein
MAIFLARRPVVVAVGLLDHDGEDAFEGFVGDLVALRRDKGDLGSASVSARLLGFFANKR